MYCFKKPNTLTIADQKTRKKKGEMFSLHDMYYDVIDLIMFIINWSTSHHFRFLTRLLIKKPVENHRQECPQFLQRSLADLIQEDMQRVGLDMFSISHNIEHLSIEVIGTHHDDPNFFDNDGAHDVGAQHTHASEDHSCQCAGEWPKWPTMDPPLNINLLEHIDDDIIVYVHDEEDQANEE